MPWCSSFLQFLTGWQFLWSAAHSIAPALKLHQDPLVFFQPLYSSEPVAIWKYSLSFPVISSQPLIGLQRDQEATFPQDEGTEEHLEAPLGSGQDLSLCSALESLTWSIFWASVELPESPTPGTCHVPPQPWTPKAALEKGCGAPVALGNPRSKEEVLQWGIKV